MRRTIATGLATAAAAALLASPLAAQSGAAPKANNFTLARGTKTQPSGNLGQIQKRGEGPRELILIAGAPFGWQVWEQFMLRNSQRYTMYAITPAGYAGTPPPPMPEDPEAFVPPLWTEGLFKGILDLVEKEELRRPVLVGHHLMSPHYVLRLAQEHPDRFSGVVAVAGSAYGPLAGGGQQVPSAKQQKSFVESGMMPFFRTVDLKTWRQNDFAASAFALDAEKARLLEIRQESVPLPEQLRYFVEFLITQTRLDVAEVRVPVLAILPEADVEAAYSRALSSGTPREQIEDYLTKKYGSLDKAHAEMRKSAAWEALRGKFPDLRIRYVADSKIFVMFDRPEAMDEAIADFVNKLPRPAAN